MKLTSQVNMLVNFMKFFNKPQLILKDDEEKPIPEDFDWLFLYVEPEPVKEPELPPPKPKYDTKIIDIDKEI